MVTRLASSCTPMQVMEGQTYPYHSCFWTFTHHFAPVQNADKVNVTAVSE